MNPRTERDLLRDYAREVVTVQSYGVPWQAGPRGELAGKTFVALQNVLDILETCDGMELTRVGIDGLRDAIKKGLS